MVFILSNPEKRVTVRKSQETRTRSASERTIGILFFAGKQGFHAVLFTSSKNAENMVKIAIFKQSEVIFFKNKFLSINQGWKREAHAMDNV